MRGIAFLKRMPCECGQVLRIAGRVGYVVESNYGKAFNVRSELNPINLAYTERGLGWHTDNPYRDLVPGFQFADGFAIAHCLADEDRQAYSMLTHTLVRFAFTRKDAALSAEGPLKQLDLRDRITAVHYNNRSIAPIILLPGTLPGFYAAYRKFALLLRDPGFQFVMKMEPGDLVISDNHRILDERTSFNSSAGRRYLPGCYLSRDSVFSAVRVLALA
jgi:gamma-butyrobetaine dioxygenase